MKGIRLMMLQRHIIFILLIFTLLVTVSATEKVSLVRDGKPVSAIILPARATSTAQFSAMELRHHIKMISGAKLPIIKEGEPFNGFGIYVGETDFARKNGFWGEDFRLEESQIKFTPSGVILIGRDLQAFGKPVYGTFTNVPYFFGYHKGTLYAAYNFLERYLGIRWYAPTDTGTAFIPRKSIEVEPKDLRQKPAMSAFRHAYMPKLLMERGREFSKYDREMLKLRWRESLNYGFCNHNVYSIWYRYWGKAKDPEKAKYFIEKRPQYFARGYNGKSGQHLIALRPQYPDDNDLPPQLCNSNRDVIRFFAREAVGKYDGTGESGLGLNISKMAGTPWFYPIEPDDNNGFCLCPECLSLFKDKRIHGKRPTNYIHFDWISRIAREAATLNPAVNIATLAYNNTLKYPTGLDIAPNVGIQMCITPYDFWVNYDGSAKKYQEWIDNGEAKKRLLTVWTYMFSGAWYAKFIDKNEFFFPMFAPEHTAKVFRKFAADGIQGWFGETPDEIGMPFWHTQLETYIAHKLADDPTQDSTQMINEFFTLYYGAAAVPMREFYRLIEDAAWEKSIYGSGTKAITEEFNWGRIGTKERMKKLAGYIAQAQSLAKSPVEKQRLAWFVNGVWKPMLAGRSNYDKKQQFRSRPVTAGKVPRVAEAGGDPQKVQWAEIVPATAFKTIAGFPGDPAKQLKFAHDNNFFYLMFTEAGDTSKLKNAPDIWSGDEIEFFLAATPERPYIQYALNPSGKSAILGYYYKNMVAFESPVKNQSIIRSIVRSDCWNIYVAIPLSELLPEKKIGAGETFCFNFFRTIPGMAALAWSPTYTNSYHDLMRMGRLTLE